MPRTQLFTECVEMKLQLFSDLHLEFGDFSPESKSADIVILAGDIHIGTKGIEWALAQQFGCPVLYVLGNHEYYGQKYPGLIQKLKTAAEGTSVYVLENDFFELDGVGFHASTLWTDFRLYGNPAHAGYLSQQVITDFKKIRMEPLYSRVRAIDLAAIHSHSLNWLGKSLS